MVHNVSICAINGNNIWVPYVGFHIMDAIYGTIIGLCDTHWVLLVVAHDLGQPITFHHFGHIKAIIFHICSHNNKALYVTIHVLPYMEYYGHNMAILCHMYEIWLFSIPINYGYGMDIYGMEGLIMAILWK